MADFIIIIILIMIALYTFKSYSKKLKHGCCGGETDEHIIKPVDIHKSHYPYIKKIYIQGMHCLNCKRRIENLFHQNPFYLLEINLNENIGLLYCKEEISNQLISEMIESLGYHVLNIETKKEAVTK